MSWTLTASGVTDSLGEPTYAPVRITPSSLPAKSTDGIVVIESLSARIAVGALTVQVPSIPHAVWSVRVHGAVLARIPDPGDGGVEDLRSHMASGAVTPIGDSEAATLRAELAALGARVNDLEERPPGESYDDTDIRQDITSLDTRVRSNSDRVRVLEDEPDPTPGSIGAAPEQHKHMVADVADATAVGAAVVTAADGAMVRGLISAQAAGDFATNWRVDRVDAWLGEVQSTQDGHGTRLTTLEEKPPPKDGEKGDRGDPGVSDVVFATGTTGEDIPPGTPANTLVVLRAP